MDLTSPQIIMRDREIARLREELAAALHEARALECERLADVGGDEPEHVKAMFSEWLREEAAAHRAKKGKGK